MTRRMLGSLAVAAALLFGPAVPAHADRGGDDRYDQREGCGEQGGGCNNHREEDYGGAGCKYVCPSFDKSPVHDAFNFSPFVCMPGATCYEDGGKRRSEESAPKDGPGPDERQRAAGPDLLCIVRSLPYHCDPKPS